MAEQDFIKAGFTVVGSEANENQLLRFLKENYPSIIKDNEINLQELKAIAGLPVDEKVNGYGLNFVGRNFARAKYAQKTDKELRLNTTLSKDIETTQNLVLKGDNLDCLKILKNHYSGKIKCIYIDPPYNTDSDEFVYPDKFDKEELEVLGLANLSEDDFARMEFSFKTKKSHNGWLAFMYPRLLLARDLLKNDGVIFISIDDNEQANLKLLCDDVFGEENFVANITVIVKTEGRRYGAFAKTHETILAYAKSVNLFEETANEIDVEGKEFSFKDELGGFNLQDLRNQNVRAFNSLNRPNLRYPFYVDMSKADENGFYKVSVDKQDNYEEVNAIEINGLKSVWRWGKEKSKQYEKTGLIARKGTDGIIRIFQKYRKLTESPKTVWFDKKFISNKGTKEVQELIGMGIFDYPKPVGLIETCLEIATKENDIILDFFAGSGTTGHAVMQLNAEDEGKRKFILCQIDEPIKEDKPAYKFCAENNLPPVISSITIERLKRAGEKIKKEIEAENSKKGLFEEDKKQVPDIGFKVFDTAEAPKLEVDEKGQISIRFNDCDALSRIYNMIFTIGLDEPTQVPEEVVKDCIYKIGSNYYITNSEKITSGDLANAIKNGKVFIDGWTASLNGTLQNYKEDVKIVF
jgi:adenine-specific DNA-methyltransferase